MARIDGKKLRDRRIAARLTQAALAKRVGVARNTINRLEIGDRDPSPALRSRLAKALGLSVVDLLGGAMVNRYGYQHEKLGDVVRTMMSPAMPVPRRVAYAMGELSLAFKDTPPPSDAREAYETIQRVMQSGLTWEARAEQLTDAELREFSEAVWSLDRRVSRAYYEAAAR